MNNKTKEILCNLIATNTSNPPGNEMELINKILNYFAKDIDYKIINHGDNRGSLVITISGTNTKAIALIGHMDTVPVSNPAYWKYNPFEGCVENGYLYGRGSSDMKGGITSMIMTGLYFINNKITPPNTIKLIFTADEESDGIGISEIRDMGLLNDVDRIFITEPTNEKIGISEKGALWLNLKVIGQESHASKPDEGLNSIQKLIDMINLIKGNIDFTKSDNFLGNTTCAITTISGGVKTNIIPSIAEATLDIRTVSGINHKDIIKISNEIGQQMLEEKTIKDFSVEVTNNRVSVSMEEDHGFIKSIEDIYQKLEYEIKYKGLYFYTDASQIIPFLDIPFVILGPGEEEMAHQTDERIELKSIDRMTEFYINYIKES